MRMRKKKHAEQRLAAHAALLIDTPEQLRQNPSAPFGNQKPLCLEIGCGKGSFITALSLRDQHKNFYAMERISDVMVTAVERSAAARKGTDAEDNLRFLIGDAGNLLQWFPAHSLETIYLNFSDPWPKKGYAKRRLTHPNFLAIYAELLRAGGEIRFKTDNDGLFAFSLDALAESPFEMIWYTDDLHASEYAEGNIMTEYETNFTSQGHKIHALCARLPMASGEESASRAD